MLWACEKDFLNPYDPATPADSWKPENLEVSIMSQNAVVLTWHQQELHIDGFEIKQTVGSNSSYFFVSKDEMQWNNNEVLAEDEMNECHEVKFSVRAKAGDQYSEWTTADTPILLPATNVADAGGDFVISNILPQTIVLNAISPAPGESGTWEVISGNGGSFSDPANSQTTFTATESSYTLQWTISGACGDSHDQLSIQSIAVGSSYEGGIVAHLFEPGEAGYIPGELHGLIVSNNNLGTANWGCPGETIATSNEFGSGQVNTQNILNGCSSTSNAAALCNGYTAEGFDDWYLPDIAQLELLYEEFGAAGLHNFDNATYSSSSEEDEYSILSIYFGTGSSGFSGKHTYLRVRAVRTF